MRQPGRLRLLYSFPHRLGSPGIGTTAFEQARGTAALGIEVSVLCASLERPVPDATRVVQTMVAQGLRVPHRLPGVERAYAYHDWRVAAELERNPGRYDVVHCWPLAARRTLAAARRTGVYALREVPNAHTAFAYERAAEVSASLGIIQPRGGSHTPDGRRLAIELEEYELADGLLVPSAFVQGTFAARGVPPQKLVRHRYGFDPARFPEPAPRPLPATGAGLVAAFVGRAEPRKGLHLALKAWRDSGAAGSGRFLVCGRFQPGYVEVLEPWLRHPSVQVLGFCDDVGPILRQADVLVLPSLEEGSALVTYEAMASGCALLVSDAAGALCSHGDEALVHQAGDVTELAAQLRRVDRDRALLAALRRAALARRPELTWARAAERLVEIYAAGAPALVGSAW